MNEDEESRKPKTIYCLSNDNITHNIMPFLENGIALYIVSKKFLDFRKLNKNVQFYLHKKNGAMKYYENRDFRNYISSLMHDTSKQLHIDLSHCYQIVDVSMLGNVYELNLTYCTEVVDVSLLGNIYKLNLSYCRRVSDVSALGTVCDLNLTYCNSVDDVSMLGGVKILDLSYITGINDVSSLRNVHTLKLLCCWNINDVSMLGNVDTLYLTSCNRLGANNISMLVGKVKNLYI
jgi:hypothetical protein